MLHSACCLWKWPVIKQPVDVSVPATARGPRTCNCYRKCMCSMECESFIFVA